MTLAPTPPASPSLWIPKDLHLLSKPSLIALVERLAREYQDLQKEFAKVVMRAERQGAENGMCAVVFTKELLDELRSLGRDDA